jgi:hypothetical protein
VANLAHPQSRDFKRWAANILAGKRCSNEKVLDDLTSIFPLASNQFVILKTAIGIPTETINGKTFGISNC